MKYFKLIVVGIVLFLATTAQAQVSVNVNIGRPPSWGPTGYSGVRYYYLPDLEAYYDIQLSNFIYRIGNKWVHRTNLPRQYRNYDLHRGYKVVMGDYRGNTPYTYYSDCKRKYARGYQGNEHEYFVKRSGRDNAMRRGNVDNRSYEKSNKKNGRDIGSHPDKKMKDDNGRENDNGQHGKGHDNDRRNK